MHCIFRTFTGKEINPLALRSEDVCIEDIAHALALCNRFAGHTKRPISVAQHSVYVSRLCDELTEGYSFHTPSSLQGLLHDASEAYIGDLTKWVKSSTEMEGYRRAEVGIQQDIARKFGINWVPSPRVEWADRVMVRWEGMQGYGKDFQIDHPDYPPLTGYEVAAIGKWGFWTWRQAEQGFLDRFRELTT